MVTIRTAPLRPEAIIIEMNQCFPTPLPLFPPEMAYLSCTRVSFQLAARLSLIRLKLN